VRITTLAEYGVICALHLARRADEGPVTGREIAEVERLPGDYVEQICCGFGARGIVRSTRGARGGYALARAAPRSRFATSSRRRKRRRSISTACRIRSARSAARRRTMQHSTGLDAAAARRSTTCSAVCLADLLAEEGEVRSRVAGADWRGPDGPRAARSSG
jgi:Rrf2 family protein